VHGRDLAAVVSETPDIEYRRDRFNMTVHMLVLEEVMREHAILPVRFGTVAPSESIIVEKLLNGRGPELNALMEEIEGRVEMGLKAFWRDDVVYREIVEEDPQIRRLRDQLAHRSPEESYYDRVRLGTMVEAALIRKRAADAEEIMARLQPLAHKAKVNTAMADSMVINAAFLVDRRRETEFDRAVREIDEALGSRQTLKYVGPTPPYNFVDIAVNWDE
jgi:hypothetical protein